jgi:hypothetical protein
MQCFDPTDDKDMIAAQDILVIIHHYLDDVRINMTVFKPNKNATESLNNSQQHRKNILF